MQDQPSFSRPNYLLQAEALCTLVAAGYAYQLMFPHHWLLFACLFLVPDLSLIPYVRGTNAAASAVYNVIHSYVLPGLLGVLAVALGGTLLGEFSLIWIAHISFDRMLGYGLKYPTSFRFTHIQRAATPVAPESAPALDQ